MLLAVMVCPSCIDDSVTTSPSAQPVFSTDTLKIGYTFTGEGTPTRTFKVFNRNGKGISISSISLREQDTDVSWRINVDGIAGASFSNVDIRANDSIFVLVEATFPKNAVSGKVKREAHLDFVINGVESTVVLHAITENVNTITDMEVVSDMRLTAETPYRIMERIAVMPGQRLRLMPGCAFTFITKRYCRWTGRCYRTEPPHSRYLWTVTVSTRWWAAYHMKLCRASGPVCGLAQRAWETEWSIPLSGIRLRA